jgi:Mg/Co/Ni transporter MgtE
LIVTDENNKLVGVLHIHDLIEAGIKWKRKLKKAKKI